MSEPEGVFTHVFTPVVKADPDSPPVSGFATYPDRDPESVWVVLIQSERMGAQATVHEVLSSDPGEHYADRLTDALALMRRPIPTSSWITVERFTVQAPPWRPL